MIFDDTQCALGEGALWHPERKELFWFDIMGKTLHSKAQRWHFDTYASAAGWIDRDTLLVATATALVRFDLTTGTQKRLTALEDTNTVTRSNDGRADPFGGFWIGTMGVQKERGAGAIYRYFKGELRQLYSGMTIPNAICFGPTGDVAYFCDTPTRQIMTVKLDAQGWPISDPAIALDFSASGENPDGAVMDSDGLLWNAQWGLGRVAGYNKAGDLVDHFGILAEQASCPAFGGDDLTTLYCTSGREDVDGPYDGMTFQIETSYKGQREHRVLL